MTKKARGKQSVLKRQKPKKARARSRREKLLTGAKWTVGLVVAGGLLWGAHRVYRMRAPSDHTHSILWKVSLKVPDETPLSDQAAAALSATVTHLLGDGSRANMQKAAKAVQRLGSYARVNIVKIAPGRVAVYVQRRTPALCIEADRLRLVSITGEVYGQVDKDNQAGCPGPTVTGIFEHMTKLPMRADSTSALTDEEQALVKEALDLQRAGQTRGYTFAHMDYHKYRGFFVTLKDSDTEIAVGRAPFAGKFEKLQEIFAKLARKNEQAQRIELDYQGKAFIKLKKM